MDDGSSKVEFSPDVFDSGFVCLLYKLVDLVFGGYFIFHIVYSILYTTYCVKLKKVDCLVERIRG